MPECKSTSFNEKKTVLAPWLLVYRRRRDWLKIAKKQKLKRIHNNFFLSRNTYNFAHMVGTNSAIKKRTLRKWQNLIAWGSGHIYRLPRLPHSLLPGEEILPVWPGYKTMKQQKGVNFLHNVFQSYELCTYPVCCTVGEREFCSIAKIQPFRLGNRGGWKILLLSFLMELPAPH